MSLWTSKQILKHLKIQLTGRDNLDNKKIGIIILGLVIIGTVAYQFVFSSMGEVQKLRGYLGGEKIGLFEDVEVAKIIEKSDRITLNYQKLGSLDIFHADLTGRDYLFPSSQTALELYQKNTASH